MSNDLLASLGIDAVLAVTPATEHCTDHDDYPTVLVTILTVSAIMSWSMLGFLMFRFKPVWLQYFRDRFEYILSIRADLEYRFMYEMRVGGELHSSVIVGTAGLTEPVELESISINGNQSIDDSLREVVVVSN